jgi:hypothetical protein
MNVDLCKLARINTKKTTRSTCAVYDYSYALRSSRPASGAAYGALTGKYSVGTPEGSRMASPMYKAITPDFADRVAKADKLKPVADKLGISLAELEELENYAL